MSSLYDALDLTLDEMDLSLQQYLVAIEKVHRFVTYDQAPRAMSAPKPRGPRKGHCYGLPRVYPKFWMATPESNSLMFEFKTLRDKPIRVRG
jgi:hypothetical protein